MIRTRLLFLASILPAALSAACRPQSAQPSHPDSKTSQSSHHVCAWMYPYDPPVPSDLAYSSFVQNAADLDAVHPMWWWIVSPSEIANHRLNGGPNPNFNDPRVLAHAGGPGQPKLIPTIAAVNPATERFVHQMVNDPSLRDRHIDQIMKIIEENRYDGVDLDYEHLWRSLDPGENPEHEREAFTAFVRMLADRMHAEGRELTLSLGNKRSVPASAKTRNEDPAEVYDYQRLAEIVDVIHLMGYDYHEEGTHAGPLSPLGWLEQGAAYAAGLEGGALAKKFRMGLPNYGLVGKLDPPENKSAKTCEPTLACTNRFTEDPHSTDYETTTSHMDHCSLAKGTYVNPGRTPNKLLPNDDRVFFEDLASLEEKIASARRGGLGGIAMFGLGGEPVAPGDLSLYQIAQSYFPRGFGEE